MGNRDIEAARTYHAATKHSYTSVRTGAYYLDWDNRPLPYKLYPEIAGLALPRDLSLAQVSALEAISGNDSKRTGVLPDAGAAGAALTLEGLTRILFCADGLTRRKRVGGEDYHFRAAPSAGALYPVEVYVATAEVEGLERGLYHFSPADLKLRGLRRGDWRAFLARTAGGRSSLLKARAIVVLSALFWRSTWKYRARAWRYCFWDAGTMLANLLAAASAEGLSSELVTAFADREAEALLDIDGEREGALCLVALGEAEVAADPSAAIPEIRPLGQETIPLSKEEASYPDLVCIHRESRLLTMPEVHQVADARPPTPAAFAGGKLVRLDTLEPDAGAGLGETILRRGSARVFTREPITAEELATIIGASSGHPRGDFPELVETYLIVNAVEGMDSGAYYYRRESADFELLKGGELRTEAGYLCLEQPLGADCAVLICYMADLDRSLRALGNRGYRDAHLEAGVHGGRAYLAAYALRRGATGLTFYDDDTTEFFAPHATGKSPLLMVAIGVPRSASE